MLEFDGAWRFHPPPDGRYRNSSIPNEVSHAFLQAIVRIGTQRNQWDTLERFKRAF